MVSKYTDIRKLTNRDRKEIHEFAMRRSQEMMTGESGKAAAKAARRGEMRREVTKEVEAKTKESRRRRVFTIANKTLDFLLALLRWRR